MMDAYKDFKKKYLKGIMEIIEAQRIAYPETAIHGYSHVARCFIITHALARLHELSQWDELKCLIAIGLHDSAREDDGEDMWEAESGRMAMSFCSDNGFDKDFQEEVFRLITEKTYVDNLPTKNFVICHDADCLDIIRVTGEEKFNPYHFASFISNQQIRRALYMDTCKLISFTNLKDSDYDSKHSLTVVDKNMKGAWMNEFRVFNPFKEVIKSKIM